MGDPFAQNTLGVHYSEGDCVPKDDKEAFKWFSKAAEKNFPPALYSLALMYYEGSAEKPDIAKALELLRRSAELGDPEAQKFLKELKEEGEID